MLSPKPRLFKVEKLSQPACKLVFTNWIRQRFTMSSNLFLGTETGLRAWFGCHVTANTVGRVTSMPSFIVNKERLTPLEVLKL